MKSEKWIKIVLIISLFNVGLLGLINYVVDPFNVFHTKFFPKEFQINERFLKLEYLDKNHEKYNAYMLGSSRVGTTKTQTLEQYISGSKFYNLSVQNANLYDQLKHLKYFIRENYTINTVYLQLDLTDLSSYGNNGTRYLIKLHPYVEQESLGLFYSQYLSGVFYTNIKKKLELNFSNKNYDKDIDIDTGYWTAPQREVQVSENCETYVDAERSFKIEKNKGNAYKQNKKAYEALKEIKQLCINNEISLYILITATNQNSMNLLTKESYLKLLEKLAEITAFYDFSGYNTVTLNNCNFYDFAHYRPLVGELIAARIFKDHNKKVPIDFGYFVNKENINNYLLKRGKEIDVYRNNTEF